MSAELLPAELLTASPCLAPFVPGPWALEWTWREGDSHLLEAAAAGVGPEHLRAVAGLVTAGLETGGFGWPNLIKTRAALEALQLVLPDPSSWATLGLALPRKHAEAFLRETRPMPGTSPSGVHELIAAQLPVPEDAAVLGFEPLGFEAGGAPHSWLCNGLETVVMNQLGVRPGHRGLISNQDDAELVAELIERPEVGAEPVLWLPWMILGFGPMSARSTAAPLRT